MLIRMATGSDADRIASLMGQLGYDASLQLIEQKFKAFADSANDAVFLAMEGGNDSHVAGCLSAHMLELFHIHGKLGRITSLVVDANMRRAGVGKALIEHSTKYFATTAVSALRSTAGTTGPPHTRSISQWVSPRTNDVSSCGSD